MICYKLCRLKKNGSITSLFINKQRELPFNEWLDAEELPKKGFAVRKGWHCTAKKLAPHLSMKNRVWVMCEINDFTYMLRPESQGGVWYLAERIKFLEILNNG
jgi:hypothetical protein